MRRNSTNPNYLKISLFALFLVLLQILSNTFLFMPTFVGVFFAYIVINIGKEENFSYIVLCFLYLSFYELNKGFFLFSYVILFIIYYYLFDERIRNNFKCKNCILFIYIIVAYIGYFFINSLFAYILNKQFPSISFEYIYYIAFDFIVSIFIFRGRFEN